MLTQQEIHNIFNKPGDDHPRREPVSRCALACGMSYNEAFHCTMRQLGIEPKRRTQLIELSTHHDVDR